MEKGLSYTAGSDLPDEAVRSFNKRFEDIVKKRPDHLALVSSWQPADIYSIYSALSGSPEHASSPYLRWTYRDLDAASNRFAAGLKSHGTSVGALIFTIPPNGFEFVLVLLAATKRGCTLVPINPRNLQNAAEVKHMIGSTIKYCTSENAILVAEDEETATQMDEYGLVSKALRFVAGEKELLNWSSFSQTLAKKEQSPDSSLRDPDVKTTDSLILFTSGTMDLPKAVLLQ